jgi:hypothetical protein
LLHVGLHRYGEPRLQSSATEVQFAKMFEVRTLRVASTDALCICSHKQHAVQLLAWNMR